MYAPLVKYEDNQASLILLSEEIGLYGQRPVRSPGQSGSSLCWLVPGPSGQRNKPISVRIDVPHRAG